MATNKLRDDLCDRMIKACEQYKKNDELFARRWHEVWTAENLANHGDSVNHILRAFLESIKGMAKKDKGADDGKAPSRKVRPMCWWQLTGCCSGWLPVWRLACDHP